jgi:pyruvate/2-oxoglutarate/acetoin dehydrogenase E1 component
LDAVSTRLSYRDAIAEAVRIEMGRDTAVVCVGSEENGATLRRLFGEDRVLDLAPADRTTLGVAAGAALAGLRPVCDTTPAELLSRGFDQLVSAAELHRSEGRAVPIVVRVRCDNDAGGEAPDPDGPERWLVPVPGLKVVAPATAGDAKGLMASAIRDPGPVCFLERVDLYDESGGVPEGAHTVEIGEARVALAGAEATLLTYGLAVGVAERAARTLDAGIEVLDLRTITPLDTGAILNSVRASGKVIVVEEAATYSPVAAAITAAIWEGAFEYLDSPLRRIGLRAVPVKPHQDRDEIELAAVRNACDELLSF